MSEIWCNGQWLSSDRYPGNAQDRGAFLGLGLFETMLAIDGVPVFPDRHLARLSQGCAKFGWPFSFPEFREIVLQLADRNDLAKSHARLRLIVTAGSGLHNDLAPGADQLIWLSAFPLGVISESTTLGLSPWPRNERSPLAGLKTACYAENLVALDHARQQGFQETVFLNTTGHLCETATANVFLVKNGGLLTPSLDSGCLPGIGRDVICEIAPRHGISCEQRPLTLDDLHAADEIFLTSSTRGPTRVSRFESREFAHGSVTAKLREIWLAEISR